MYYRTRIQPTIALSSTEAELAAMSDAGRAALYLRSILEEINLPQNFPTTILADNHGALHLCNANQPSVRTRHIDIKHFAIVQWSEEEAIHFTSVPTSYNYSDSLSKQTGRIKFHEHRSIYLGYRQPKYVSDETPTGAVNKYIVNAFSTWHVLDPTEIWEHTKCGGV